MDFHALIPRCIKSHPCKSKLVLCRISVQSSVKALFFRTFYWFHISKLFKTFIKEKSFIDLAVPAQLNVTFFMDQVYIDRSKCLPIWNSPKFCLV